MDIQASTEFIFVLNPQRLTEEERSKVISSLRQKASLGGANFAVKVPDDESKEFDIETVGYCDPARVARMAFYVGEAVRDAKFKEADAD